MNRNSIQIRRLLGRPVPIEDTETLQSILHDDRNATRVMSLSQSEEFAQMQKFLLKKVIKLEDTEKALSKCFGFAPQVKTNKSENYFVMWGIEHKGVPFVISVNVTRTVPVISLLVRQDTSNEDMDKIVGFFQFLVPA